MDLAERFRTAVSAAYRAETASAELVPVVLAQACVEVLPVAGAGLSITDELRVPLGASDDHAAHVERVQVTLGEGPCLSATQQKSPQMADLETIALRWPMFHRHFVQTPFRSVISLPLLSRNRRLHLGALDLYLTNPEKVPEFFVAEVTASVADPIAAVLFGAQAVTSGERLALPPWFDNEPVADRMHVWVAVGILIEHAGMSNADALAALRAYAFSHDVTLDDLADELMSDRLRPEALLA
jgi:hypothetical protein